jgi:hypothetical protein|nr:hypothetical protein [Bradyrhizobium sp. WSM1417]
MIAPGNAPPRRYFVDAVGRRVLIGLTIEETQEFEGLDRKQAGQGTSDRDGETTSALGPDEQRWMALYEKHDSAWRNWIVHAVCV